MLNVLFKLFSPLMKAIDLVQFAHFATGEWAGTGLKVAQGGPVA